MSIKEKFKELQASVRAQTDTTHLFPPEDQLYYARVNWERQRVIARPRSTVSLMFEPSYDLHPFFLQE